MIINNENILPAFKYLSPKSPSKNWDKNYRESDSYFHVNESDLSKDKKENLILFYAAVRIVIIIYFEMQRMLAVLLCKEKN